MEGVAVPRYIISCRMGASSISVVPVEVAKTKHVMSRSTVYTACSALDGYLVQPCTPVALVYVATSQEA